MPVPATPTIDTTSLLTILGVVAAAWALISPTAKLSFRLCMTRLDWAIIATLVLAIHVLVFEEVLRALGAYPVLGPWRWGMDKNGAIYLLFLSLTAFVFWRSRTLRLSTRKLPLFDQLATALLHSRKFAELGELLSQHLSELVATSQVAGYRSRLAAWLAPSAEGHLVDIARQLTAQPTVRPTPRASTVDKWRARLAQTIRFQQPSDASKRAILKKLLSSNDLVGYLALTHPYLCLSAMKPLTGLVDDFQDVYFEALLANTSSVFFTEIRNSANRSEGNRVHISPENRLLSFYCKDVRAVDKLDVCPSVGEALLVRIESDDALANELNKPLLRYNEKGKLSCPIYCGVYFFRIMVLEGLYQHVPDHLWLHYVTHVAKRILQRMRPALPEDEDHDYPTPYSYLLFSLVKVTSDWIEESMRVTDPKATAELSKDQVEGAHAFIAFEAAEALGRVMHSVLASEKATERLKGELLENILFMLRRVAKMPHLSPLVRAVMAALVNPYLFGAQATHLDALSQVYSKQDHRLRDDTKDFAQVLTDARASLSRVSVY